MKSKPVKSLAEFTARFGYPLTRRTVIDDEHLKHVGFVKLEKQDPVNRDVWELKIPYYPHKFRFIKGNYPANNPNCGIVSIYEPAGEAVGFEQAKGGKVKKVIHKFSATSINIAYYVNTAERLKNIILALTETNI